jgi:3-hydroxyacyl-CoA dehydrogenase/enoyl-CoA hydratase/3-hydroxybutyryl-CoA epimerase
MSESSATGDPQWSLEIDAERVAWLTIDQPGASANALSRAVLEELAVHLADLAQKPPRGLVITSGKVGFIAGADVREFGQVKSAEDAVPHIRKAHALFNQLEALPFPTVAAINGYCLGGGLELALACRYRICVDDPKAVLGLPEVLLGIHPGFGGTVRTVRQVGVTAAMDMMLSGRNVRPDRALQLGLVDRVVPAGELRHAASDVVMNPPAPRRPSLAQRLLSVGPARALLAPKIEQQVAKRAKREHYPAPYAIVDLWRKHGASPRTGYEAEAQSVARLVCTPTARNLVRVFFLQERLKALGGSDLPQGGHLHVVGAGVMGGDIAAWAALRGFTVTLQDLGEQSIQLALERARAFFDKRPQVPGHTERILSRLVADVEGDAVGRADVVIEAIVEDAAAKRDLFARLEPRLKPGAILATSTSSLALEDLAGALADPGRLVGLHFFDPVPQVPLVEVIECGATSPATRTRALAFTRALDKLPLPCRSAPGFLVNRILMPYLHEAMLAAQEGVPLATIDRVARDFGMPIGPIELADTIGLDVCLRVGRVIATPFHRPAPEAAVDRVATGKLGRKTGQGLYEWRDGKAVKPSASDTAPADLEDRLILPMLNEAIAVLRGHVVADADLVDAGVIFGTGFAPFRGGPLRYARERGTSAVVARLREFESRYGVRFRPDPGWDAFAARTL